MQLNYEYASPSVCLQEGDQITLGLSPELSREEKVSFLGKLREPLIFRDAMLMLREIVISDTRVKKKDYSEFFHWVNEELDRRMAEHKIYLDGYKEELKEKANHLKIELFQVENDIQNHLKKARNLQSDIENYPVWDTYHKIERSFWNYIRTRDHRLWMILDPVITVHPDQVSFEAFSLDESTYGCLSIDRQGFDIIGEPKLGTTNIDFSAKLADQIERFRTYNDVELAINPEGFIVDTGTTPKHLEKKIDLPDSWIKGFNQVSAAATLGGISIDLSPVDMYDICSFLRRNKAHKSPRAMKWILVPQKRIRIVFEPWNKELTLSTIYQGKQKRMERVYGRRRWLILERIIPIADSFKLRLLGFGMPQFIIADLGNMKMTVGFTSWSANDWVKGTTFNIMAGFIGRGTRDVYNLLKSKRKMTLADLKNSLKGLNKKERKASIGDVLRRGEAYFDPIVNALRFRQLLNVPLPRKLYKGTKLEEEVLRLLKSSNDNFTLQANDKSELIARNFRQWEERKKKRRRRRRRYYYDYRSYNEPEYTIISKKEETELVFDQDKQVSKLKCDCKVFKRGPRNISSPCAHILAVYITSIKFLNLTLKPKKEYTIRELEDMVKK